LIIGRRVLLPQPVAGFSRRQFFSSDKLWQKIDVILGQDTALSH